MNKKESYQELQQQLTALLAGEMDHEARNAQFCAFVYHRLADISWAGFYWLKEQQLVLGCFQGKPACYRIPLEQGVCGASVQQKTVMLVADVHQFSGHIACDTDTRSECVIPLIKHEKIIGVFDLDSTCYNRFSQQDAEGVNQLCQILLQDE